MSSSNDPQGQQLRQFHEQSLDAARTQQEHDADVRERHRGEEGETDKQAHEDIVHDLAAEERKKEANKEWRKKDKLNKEAIEADKKRRLDETARLEEKKRKDREYEEKQHEFFESFRAAAAAKASAERKATERDIALKEEILREEKAAFAAKQKALADESIAKNDIERTSLQRKDEIRRTAQAKRDELFGEGARVKVQYKDDALRKALQDIQKKRTDTDAEERHQLSDLQTETIRKKSEIESKTRRTRDGIDADFYAKKAELNRRRRHVGEPEEDD